MLYGLMVPNEQRSTRFSYAKVVDSDSNCRRNFVISSTPSDDTKLLTDSALPYPHGYPAREQNHYISFSGAIRAQNVKVNTSSQRIIFERLNTRCQPPRGSQADMRKIATRLRFLSRDRGIYAPLVHGTPSHQFLFQPCRRPRSDSGCLGAPEPVSPGVRKDDAVSIDSPVVSPRTYDEPIVTRKELWSYYRMSCSSSFPRLTAFCSFPVYYNGDNVRLLSCSLLG
jgi:hypothetical protein